MGAGPSSRGQDGPMAGGGRSGGGDRVGENSELCLGMIAAFLSGERVRPRPVEHRCGHDPRASILEHLQCLSPQCTRAQADERGFLVRALFDRWPGSGRDGGLSCRPSAVIHVPFSSGGRRFWGRARRRCRAGVSREIRANHRQRPADLAARRTAWRPVNFHWPQFRGATLMPSRPRQRRPPLGRPSRNSRNSG